MPRREIFGLSEAYLESELHGEHRAAMELLDLTHSFVEEEEDQVLSWSTNSQVTEDQIDAFFEM